MPQTHFVIDGSGVLKQPGHYMELSLRMQTGESHGVVLTQREERE